MNRADQELIHWLKSHGGTGVFVKTKASAGDEWRGGGKAFIAAGEVAPFNYATIKRIVSIGKATQDGNRVTLIEGGAA